jgi:hypothetical protein
VLRRSLTAFRPGRPFTAAPHAPRRACGAAPRRRRGPASPRGAFCIGRRRRRPAAATPLRNIGLLGPMTGPQLRAAGGPRGGAARRGAGASAARQPAARTGPMAPQVGGAARRRAALSSGALLLLIRAAARRGVGVRARLQRREGGTLRARRCEGLAVGVLCAHEWYEAGRGREANCSRTARFDCPERIFIQTKLQQLFRSSIESGYACRNGVVENASPLSPSIMC